jgi:cobalt-precorrin 5A hydrolase / cobalt-factor III methyltransferase / precorrin-3B C17-methyltransferase
VIGLIAVTAAGRAGAASLAAAWPGRTASYEGPARQSLTLAWEQCDELVCFLAVGAVVRLIAPLLTSKQADPAVVCVDEGRRYAVAVTGGHAAGGNDLATRVADVLGAQPVITTATDAAGLPGLDTLGWPAEGAIAAVSRALLDGLPVHLEQDHTWPLPPLPVSAGRSGGSSPPGNTAARPAVAEATGHRLGASRGNGPAPRLVAAPQEDTSSAPAGHRIVVTDRLIGADEATVLLRPPSLVAGVGASRGVSAAEVLGLLGQALTAAGLTGASLTALATVEAKATEPGIVQAAASRGVPLLSFPAGRLAGIEVPNPSQAALAAVGTPSVAEAAAIAAGGELIVPKLKSAMATLALGRIRPRGRLALIGLGPGARDLLTPRAVAELRRASVVVGLDQYLGQIRDLLRPGTTVLGSGLGAEEERARAAVSQARRGHAVALVGSGDAGIYALAGPALQLAGPGIDVITVPGITASAAAAALLGAPLGHDHAVISLSDLHTPWDVIAGRVRCAAEADLVVAFYNPRSSQRTWQLPAALGMLAAHRPPGTPAGVVRDATRDGQAVTLTTLGEIDPQAVDMRSIVIVGSSQTKVIAGRMVTPRGYPWQS